MSKEKVEFKAFKGPPKRWSSEDIETWLNTRKEVPYFPDVPIVDAHHHLFPSSSIVPANVEIPAKVFATFGRAAATGRYLREEITRDFKGVNVVATVHVEAKSNYDKTLEFPSIGETYFLRRIFEENHSSGLCKGIVAAVDLTVSAEKVKRQIDGHRIALKGSGCVLSGMRIQIGNHPGLASPAAPKFAERCVDGAKVLGSHELPLDVWLYHSQIPELLALAESCPTTVFVCDHAATPVGSDRIVFQEWQKHMTGLARAQNVLVKLGGLGMHVCGHSGEDPLISDEIVERLFPWYEHMFRVFGEDRVILESNFPMDKASFSYLAYWNAAKKIAVRLSSSPNVRRKLLFANSNRVYKLDLALPDISLYSFETPSKL